jgi:hypothetical protein
VNNENLKKGTTLSEKMNETKKAELNHLSRLKRYFLSSGERRGKNKFVRIIFQTGKFLLNEFKDR